MAVNMNMNIGQLLGYKKPTNTLLTLKERMEMHPDIDSEIKNQEILDKYTEGETFNMTKLLDDLGIPKYK